MSSFGGFGLPGYGAAAYTSEREIIWGGDDMHIGILRRNSVISGTARDAGNTPTTVLRRGLLLGKIAATGELAEWNAAATDGTANVAAILNNELRATDFDASNTDRAFGTLLKAPLIANTLLIQGAAFVGHADEYLARRQLDAAGCVLDDDPFGYKAGKGFRVAAKTADYTVTDDDNGTYFTNKGAAGAVVFTLPTVAKRGLQYKFMAAAAQTLTLASGTADTLVVLNDAAADSVSYQTANEIIGGGFKVTGDGALWIVEPIRWEAQTVTTVTA